MPMLVQRAAWLLAAILVSVVAQGPHTANRLRVEYLESPLGIDVPSPRFSYALVHPSRGQSQTAYEIVVSSAGAVVWDSGKVSSNETTNIAFGGSLKSDTDYSWTVRRNAWLCWCCGVSSTVCCPISWYN